MLGFVEHDLGNLRLIADRHPAPQDRG